MVKRLFEDSRAALKAPFRHLVSTITRPGAAHAGWSGERGHLSRALLERVVGDLRAPVFYAAGPPGFVEAMGELLASARVASTDLRTEAFFGY